MWKILWLAVSLLGKLSFLTPFVSCHVPAAPCGNGSHCRASQRSRSVCREKEPDSILDTRGAPGVFWSRRREESGPGLRFRCRDAATPGKCRTRRLSDGRVLRRSSRFQLPRRLEECERSASPPTAPCVSCAGTVRPNPNAHDVRPKRLLLHGEREFEAVRSSLHWHQQCVVRHPVPLQ